MHIQCNNVYFLFTRGVVTESNVYFGVHEVKSGSLVAHLN